MSKRILIVGGGTAGCLTAGYLARTLGARSPGGVDEATLVGEARATFKQGARFAHWRFEPGQGQPDHYLHSFQVTQEPWGLDLMPNWPLGAAGDSELSQVNICGGDNVENRAPPGAPPRAMCDEGRSRIDAATPRAGAHERIGE